LGGVGGSCGLHGFVRLGQLTPTYALPLLNMCSYAASRVYLICVCMFLKNGVWFI
jgi:hypothetical protein